MRNRCLCCLSLLALLGAPGLTLGQEQEAKTEQEQGPGVEPRVDEILRRMSDALEGTSQFAFKAEVSLDEIHQSGIKIQLSSLRSMAVRRPDGVVTDIEGDMGHRSTWYDGKKITVLDKRHNVFSVIEAPGDLDSALDFVADKYDIVLPLADFARSDVYESLRSGALVGMYLGLHRVDGAACHHVTLANEYLEWQLWVDSSGPAVPRKIVINYKDEPGEPQFVARFLSWNLKLELPDETFQFEPPEGATPVEMEVVIPRLTTKKEPGS